MDKHIEDACEQLDAAIFSGDFLECEDRRKEFKVYLDRWNRAMRKENFKKFMHCGRLDCEWCNERYGRQNAD